MIQFKFLVLLSNVFAISLAKYAIDADYPNPYDLEEYDTRFRRALQGGNPNECVDPICKTFTSKLLAAMNHNADACEEFYELVCGKRNQPQDGLTSDNFMTLHTYLNIKISYTSEKYLQDFKRFYSSCLQYSLDFDYLNKLDFIKASKTDTADITDIFVSAILTQSMPFFDVGLDISANDKAYQLVLTLPGVQYLKTITSSWSVFEEIELECTDIVQSSVDTKNLNLDEMYLDYVSCKKNLLAKYAEEYEKVMKSTSNMTSYEAYLQELLLLSQKFQVSQDEVRSTEISKTFTPMDINQITAKYGLIDWKSFFGNITNNKIFNGSEIVLVAFPDQFQLIFEELRNTDKDKLINMLQEFGRFQQYRNLLVPKKIDRSTYCMNLAHEIMPDVVSAILYELNPTKKTFFPVYHANKMFSDLQTAFGKAINESKLDTDSKEVFGKKLNKLTLGLITVADVNNTRDNYRNIKVRGNFHDNLLALMTNYRKFIYSLVGSKSSAATLLNLFVSPFANKPKAFYANDAIVLHPDIFNYLPIVLPEHIRLAKLGFAMAQSIAQHFDPTGRLFMTDGIRSNDEFYEELTNNTLEIFDTYYTKTPLEFHQSTLNFKPVNGKLFVNELISDSAAFRLVTDYFQNMKKSKELPWIGDGNITLSQSFFIAFAQEFCDDQYETSFLRQLFEKRHLPPQIKIRNIVSNSALFAQTFNCVEGSSYWMDPSVTRQFPHEPVTDYDSEDD